jgi:hypothetical protein
VSETPTELVVCSSLEARSDLELFEDARCGRCSDDRLIQDAEVQQRRSDGREARAAHVAACRWRRHDLVVGAWCAANVRWLAVAQVRVRGRVRSDVAALRGSAAVDGIMRATLAGGTDPATGLAATVWRDQLAGLFAATLAANPAYLQMRYVGVAEDGREIVRVDRSGPDGAIRVTPEAELQPKANRPYFQEAIGLAAGQIYVSPIELNQEHGAIETPHVPVLRTAMPVFAADDRPFGLLVINVDLRQAFGEVRGQAPPGGQVYVIGDRGDYFVHPDTRPITARSGMSLRHMASTPEITRFSSTRPSSLRAMKGNTLATTKNTSAVSASARGRSVPAAGCW